MTNGRSEANSQEKTSAEAAPMKPKNVACRHMTRKQHQVRDRRREKTAAAGIRCVIVSWSPHRLIEDDGCLALGLRHGGNRRDSRGDEELSAERVHCDSPRRRSASQTKKQRS